MAGTDRNLSDGAWAKLLPAVILMHPQMGENIGASARAMKNCGLRQLHIIRPRDGWPNPAATALASAGADILERAVVHETLLEASKPYTLIAATTARPRSVAKPTYTPDEAGQVLAEHAKGGGTPALLFGGERAGLDRASIAVADCLITVPLNPAFASLNLAQAVLLIGWACRCATMAHCAAMEEEDTVEVNEPLNPYATAEEKQFFFATLEAELAQSGFFANPDMRPTVMHNIMALFQRSNPSQQEIRTLHGIIKALKKMSKKINRA